MKMTIELPDALIGQIKETALRRRMSLKELFTHALKREVGTDVSAEHDDFELNEIGLPILKRRNKKVTNALVRRLE